MEIEANIPTPRTRVIWGALKVVGTDHFIPVASFDSGKSWNATDLGGQRIAEAMQVWEDTQQDMGIANSG